MATDRLYYNDCYRAVFDATVLQISGDGRNLVLDRSVFYPMSGGQPRDFGRLEGREVTDIVEQAGELLHILAEPVTASPGDVIRGEIDWVRRYDHMQQHTGQHLLSAVFAEMLELPTLSFHMGDQASTVELGAPAVSAADLLRVEERVNQMVWAALPVTVSYEEAAAAQGLRKASEREGTLRIVEIAGVDRSACGGTHVRTTAEIGAVQIRGSDKVRGNLRLAFACGGRLVRQSRQDFGYLNAVARELGCSAEGVEQAAARLRERLGDAEKAVKRLTAEVATREGEALYRQTPAGPDGRRYVAMERAVLDESARQTATAFTRGERGAIAIWAERSRSVLLAVSLDYGASAGAVLKEWLAIYGGKGGGSAAMAQGSLPEAANMTSALADLQRRLGTD